MKIRLSNLSCVIYVIVAVFFLYKDHYENKVVKPDPVIKVVKSVFVFI